VVRERRSALYRGEVVHRRLEGPKHGFRYPVYLHLLDLDELEDLDRDLRLFGHDRPRPVAFRDSDHLGDPRRPLRANVEAFLRESGSGLRPGRIEILTHCRVFGYVFNPVSFIYCYDEGDRLAAVVAEVNNTFGERHPYLLEVDGESRVWVEKKVFHVSPFFPLDGSYRWEVPEPGPALRIRVDLTRGGRPALAARMSLARLPLTDASLARALLRYPLMTGQVIGAIHWEALRLWWKRAPFWTKPPYDPEAARGGPA
jgi:DUF1365 family protein